MRYTLNNESLTRRGALITVVGCGGTGGFVAEGLCRLALALGRLDLQLVLVDNDRVEERNLHRQNFYRQDLGEFKAKALAERLVRLYGYRIGYELDFITPLSNLAYASDLIIGCVDNPAARAALAQYTQPFRFGKNLWWLDSGNGESFGQVAIGNAEPNELKDAFDESTGLCFRLPKPTVQLPELLTPPSVASLAGLNLDDPSCAVLVEHGEQSPVINQLMAGIVLEMTRRLMLGKLSWMRVDLDLDRAEMRPVYATPENAARAAGRRKTGLLIRRE